MDPVVAENTAIMDTAHGSALQRWWRRLTADPADLDRAVITDETTARGHDHVVRCADGDPVVLWGVVTSVTQFPDTRRHEATFDDGTAEVVLRWDEASPAHGLLVAGARLAVAGTLHRPVDGPLSIDDPLVTDRAA